MANGIRDRFVQCTLATVLLLASSLLATLAQAGTGGLDPAFADHGRLSQIDDVNGVARSVEILDQGGILIGGGDVFVYDYRRGPEPRSFYQVRATSFIRRVDEYGAVDPTLTSVNLPAIEASSTARQADGMLIGVGSVVVGNPFSDVIARKPAIFRLASDGSRDPGFGNRGIITWPDRVQGRFHSVVIEPDGRIVVAGNFVVTVNDEEARRLVVFRRLADGSRDRTFGKGGSYIGPKTGSSGGTDLVRTVSGAYRVIASGCTIVGLTANGTSDRRFGNEGIAAVRAPGGNPAVCGSLEEMPNGRLLVAGRAMETAFVTRVLANGAPDSTFAADEMVAESLTRVTAAAATSAGQILVAGTGPAGTSIMRLQATGERDALFGDDGRTLIDLPSVLGSAPEVHDIAVGDAGTVIAAGGGTSGDHSFLSSGYEPFAVRLFGDAGGVSPGVVSIFESSLARQESGGPAIVRVRRTGGSDGEVSVSYRTFENSKALTDQDFVATSGTLTWRNGDTSDREIAVDLIEDETTTERRESFGVALFEAQGGAGLGTSSATIFIQPDGSPAGQLNVDPVSIAWGESPGKVEMWLTRRFYFEGRVCVTLKTTSGSAKAGQDFVFTQITHCWEDGETEARFVEVPIIDDRRREPDENFVVELLNPTGGAVVGRGSATFRIVDYD